MHLGYADAAYARSLAELGTPVRLEHCAGWILERPIPGTDRRDAMGCYPLFSCRHWPGLGADLDCLRQRGVISLTLVSDPFAAEEAAAAASAFDMARPFKRHFVANLGRAATQICSEHHRYHARRALRQLEVDVCRTPSIHLDEWCALYEHLIARYEIAGVRAFSRRTFRALLEMDGVVLLRALKGGAAVGGQIVLRQGDVAYIHLAAFSPEGYRSGASYALDWATLEMFRGEAEWLDWGGAAGLADDAADGLAQYKRGWSTDIKTTWLLGAVLDQDGYRSLARAPAAANGSYFPAYRAGEFGKWSRS